MTIIRTDHARAVTGDALRQCTVATPIGPLLLVASDAGLRAVLWPGEDGGRIRLSLDAVPRISARAQNLRGAAEILRAGGDSATWAGRRAVDAHLAGTHGSVSRPPPAAGRGPRRR